MRIAIYDSDVIFSQNLKLVLYKYSNLYKYEFLIDVFEKSDALLSSKNDYFLIFMEYSLNKNECLITAKELRRRNSNLIIVFLTSSSKINLQAFDINPHSFMTKPLFENNIFSALDEIFSNSPDHLLCINSGIETICLNTNEIFYLEANNKNCIIHLESKTIDCKKTMAKAVDALPKTHFQKINRAFIVNINQINQYNNDYVSLKNGKKLHITRTYFKDFKQNYNNHLCPKII